ncbi:control protein E1A [Simian adenovirus DM-2014]|uniref:Early E1A protein n=1 Tax=Simian adenovirus DM-2014 TaxID=1560346 RepID=A0A097IWA3_9ADEN|nr:control protein E1A [Simian adenovirus DM-2014]AIT70968.1 control protein E1A [Simian adenovirus DM-2014]
MRTPLLEGDFPVRLAAEILSALAEEVFADVQPPRAFEDVSLHDLFDLEVDDGEDPNREAVDSIFPESLLLAAEEGVDIPRNTPPPLELPVVLSQLQQQQQMEMPDLTVGEVNLICSESSFSSLESEQAEKCMAEAAASGVASVERQEKEEAGMQFKLDCPDMPGHGCQSCEYHREQTGEREILCSLCYLRRNGMFVYSPVSEAEADEPDTTTDEQGCSPPKLGQSPPSGVVRPQPVRATSRRRNAVDSLSDLLDDDDCEPLDLTLAKRARR